MNFSHAQKLSKLERYRNLYDFFLSKLERYRNLYDFFFPSFFFSLHIYNSNTNSLIIVGA